MTSTTPRFRRALGVAALGLALGAGLTACGEDDTTTTAEVSATEHNDADVAFATDMIQHHAQALSMVDLTMDRPLDPEVEALAEQIRAAQAPEIEQMVDWLTSWGEDVPETVRDHANAGHDMSDMDGSDMGDDMGDDMGGMDPDMPGMMSAADMDALASASDEEFQDMWLEMMIEHHEGAVEMAETERSEGRFEDAVDLAGSIIDSQSEEIATMQDLLGS
jgi:uncharacterized protein (DUF305 family)